MSGIGWTKEKIEHARGRAGMAAMVDIDTFLSALDEIEHLTAALAKVNAATCEWKYYGRTWGSECGEEWAFKENEWEFCPKCGKRINYFWQNKENNMPSTTIQYFGYEHLPPQLQKVSKPLHDLAHLMEEMLPDGPEKSAGMRKLLEAKDCFVRANIVTKE